MKRLTSDSIHFAANPFVAVADFVIVLLLIMVLATVHQSISSSNLLSRMAVDALQKRLLAELSGSGSQVMPDPVLKRAFQTKLIQCTFTDGDLQRFWFDGKVFFSPGSAIIEPRGKEVLDAFRKVLSQYQGDRSRRGNGLFKYIIVEGHADPAEGDAETVKSISFQRANEAVRVLHANGTESGVSAVLIKPCGRGDLDRGNFYLEPDQMKKMSRQDIVARNRRIEIVVVYSGKRAIDYYQENYQD